MEIFFSWSGTHSHDVARTFREWLPTVIQDCRDIFLSSALDKGDPWFSSITQAATNADLALVFITAENTDSQWLNFEAGAMMTGVGSRLCPVLVDLSKADYNGPMKNYQLTALDDDEDLFGLLKTINDTNAEIHERKLKLPEDQLREEFELKWPKLKAQLEEATRPHQQERVPARTIEDKIDEILTLVRPTRSPGPSRTRLDPITGRFMHRTRQTERTLAGVDEDLFGLNEVFDIKDAPDIKTLISSQSRPLDPKAQTRLFGQMVSNDGTYLGKITDTAPTLVER